MSEEERENHRHLVVELRAVRQKWWHGHEELTKDCALCNAEYVEALEAAQRYGFCLRKDESKDDIDD